MVLPVGYALASTTQRGVTMSCMQPSKLPQGTSNHPLHTAAVCRQQSVWLACLVLPTPNKDLRKTNAKTHHSRQLPVCQLRCPTAAGTRCL